MEAQREVQYSSTLSQPERWMDVSVQQLYPQEGTPAPTGIEAEWGSEIIWM
jgi:hypothetical protein